MTPSARRLSRASAWLAATLLFALLWPSTGHATAYAALSFEERLELAVDVFVGRVRSVDGERRGDDPWTLVSLEVEAWLLRDEVPTEVGPFEVTLAFLGGQAAGVAPRQVAGLPTFTVGERVLVATYGDESVAASPLVGVSQGFWRDDDDVWRDDAGEALALDAAGRPHLSGAGDPLALWLPALAERLRELRGEP